jgi:hypothetical protein
VQQNSKQRAAGFPLWHRTTLAGRAPDCLTLAGEELEQIQFLLGLVSVPTTERYLGRKQRFGNAVNDRTRLEPDLVGTQ